MQKVTDILVNSHQLAVNNLYLVYSCLSSKGNTCNSFLSFVISFVYLVAKTLYRKVHR
ncbi:hypothetical protein KL86DYS1_11385 [uncultured Dysgonomonas sp.]|uniref:Uncharacterized protein n=1 Tax=uncultured Dysgonomonas sp. TaxID=206096 RepID=A0A212J891_9BACT|nr:hypothetical protein KL86DYS1_11385 [uncultured Dysgonomonas sp.]